MANFPTNELVEYRAVERFALGRNRHCKPGDKIEFEQKSDVARRLVDIGRIVKADFSPSTRRAAHAAAKAADIKLSDDAVAYVTDALNAAWNKVMVALREQPVEALELAFELEGAEDGKQRERLLGQLRTEIDARHGAAASE